MLCLKDPYAYYGLMPMDKITFSMLNVTLDAAKGVAWDKEQQMLQASPWFLSHGQMNASRVAPQWQPSKHIELVFGSNNNHVVGRALFCLDGETIIKTTDGDFKLKDLENKEIKVYSLDNENQLVESDICTVTPTIKTNEEYEIELEDGSIIKCTPNHKFMLKDGTYKEAQYLTEDDELADICYNKQALGQKNIKFLKEVPNTEDYFNFIEKIIKNRGQWASELKNKYCERHHIIPKCYSKYPKTLTWFPQENIIWLTPQEHFIAHKLLALHNPLNDKLVSAFKRMCFSKRLDRYIVSAEDYAWIKENWGKAHSKQLKGRKLTPEQCKNRKFSEERKQEYSLKFSGKNNPMYGKGYKLMGEKNGCYGKPIEGERLEKIKKARTKYLYIYNNIPYYGWIELQKYLASIGIKISQKGIESCIEGTEQTKIKFPQLWKNIKKILKEDYHENSLD